MNEQDPLERIAENYRRNGYDVTVHPSALELPAFLSADGVDLLARKGDAIMTLSINPTHPSEEQPFRINTEPGTEYAASLLNEAESLLTPKTVRSAFVMAWSAFEAAARIVLASGSETYKASPRQLVDALHQQELISDEEFYKLIVLLQFRAAIVHGVRAEDLSPESVSLLLGIARRLLPKSSDSTRRFSLSVSAALVHGEIIRLPILKEWVDRATGILLELLGPSRGSVSIEWNLAEDTQNQPVVVLRISDLTGAVTATFEPKELGDLQHIKTRLNHLWGDLLQIRSHTQIQRLLQLTEN